MSTHRDGNALDDLLDEQNVSPAPPVAPVVDDPVEDVPVEDDPVEDDPVEDSGDEFGDWLSAPVSPRRLPRLTSTLAMATLVAVAFIGGVLVQKQNDQSLAAATGPAGGAAGRPGGFGGGFGGAAAGGGAGAAGSTAGSTAAGPAVIGQVASVNGTVLVVRNLAGKDIQVILPAGVSITRQTTVTASTLAKGTNVVVTGTTGANGAVTATGVTAH